MKTSRKILSAFGGAVVALQSFALLAAPPTTPPMWGVNLAGGEFTSSAIPGTHGTHYTYPGVANFDYYKSRGIELIRLPFKWERLQRTLYGPLDPGELARIDGVLDLIEARGMRVILDMHNYARYNLDGTVHIIGTPELPRAAFQDVWAKIAAHVKHRDSIWAYGIMNEPNKMNGNTWKDSAQYAVNGIRSQDTRHAILLPGDQWSGAHWWLTHGANLITVVDPSNNVIYEAHQYFDEDSSGQYKLSYAASGATPNTGVSRLTQFVNWCNANGVRGFIGEYGVPDNNPNWLTVLDNALAYMVANNISGTYWAGGPVWGTYTLSTEMRRLHEEAPQMGVLIPYGSGVGTRHWPSYTWYRDSVASSPAGSYTYHYKSDNASMAVNFEDPTSAVGNYNGMNGIRFDYTVPSNGWAGAGMHISNGVALEPNFARNHVLSFSIRGTAGSSVRIFLRDVDLAQSAKVNTAAYVTTTGSWQKVSIPLSAFVTASFTGTKRIERLAFEGLPANNTAHTVRLDNFIIEKPDVTGPTTTVASPNGSSFNLGASFTATATASDPSGIDFVEFLLNGERVAIAETAPYAATLSLPVEGQYRLVAIAYDLHGNPGRSAPVNLTALGAAPPRTLIASDTWDQTSFTSGARWSDGQVPHTGAPYRVEGRDLRSPGGTASHTFGGDSLTLSNGGRLLLRTTGAGVVTIPDLRADNGIINLALNGTFTLAGQLALQSGGLAVVSGSANRHLVITAPISGPGALSVGMGGANDHTTLTSSANTYAGGTVITQGVLRAHADAALGLGDVTVANSAGLRLAQGVSHNYIADSATLIVGSNASVELAFTGVDHLAALSLDGGATFAAAGEWGAIGSGATHTSPRLTGSGRLQVGVTTFVHLLASDTWEQTSFTSGARWSDGQVPHAGATYVVDGISLRSPGNTQTHTFSGDALVLMDGGALVMRTTSPGAVFIDDLRSAGGVITLALNGSFTLGGELALQGGGLAVNSASTNRHLTIASKITGMGALSVSMASATDHTTLTHSANTYAGGTTVSTGILRAHADGVLGSGNVTVANGARLRLASGIAHNYLADSATLVVGATATVELAYSGVDTLAALSLDGGITFVAPGEWGAVGSGAPNTSARFTGIGRLLVTGASGGFALWRDTMFPATDRDNLAISAPSAAPFGDGVANLLRFACGFEPGQPFVAPVATASEGRLALSYRQRVGGVGRTGIDYVAEGVSYKVEVTTDLAANTWSSGPHLVEAVGDPVALDDLIEEVTVRLKSDLTPSSPTFMRLRITML